MKYVPPKKNKKSVQLNHRIPRIPWDSVEAEYAALVESTPEMGKSIRPAEVLGAALLCFAEKHSGELREWVDNLHSAQNGSRPLPRSLVEGNVEKGLVALVQDAAPSASTKASSKKRATS